MWPDTGIKKSISILFHEYKIQKWYIMFYVTYIDKSIALIRKKNEILFFPHLHNIVNWN